MGRAGRSEGRAADGGSVDDSRGPVLVVERSAPSGAATTTALVRDGAGLVLLDDRGRRRHLGTDDVRAAIGRLGALKDVRANEATAFFASSGGPSVEEVARLLRLRQVELLSTEEPVEFTGRAAALNGIGAMAGVSRRAVAINGHRWIAIPPGPGVRPRVLRQAADGGWEPVPAFTQQWGSFSCTEESSMTSGVSTWALGLLDGDLIGALGLPDEEQPVLTVRHRGRRPAEDEIVEWVDSVGGEYGLDLLMLLVETRIGRLDGEQVPAARFTDGSSETLMCDLWVDGRTEGLLRAVVRRRRSDAIDAVVRPRSRAAARRAVRLIEPAD